MVIQAVTPNVAAQSSAQGMIQTNVFSNFNWKTTVTVAQVAVALFMVANLPVADAGPAAYAACCALCAATYGPLVGCTSAGTLLPLMTGTCVTGCWPSFVAPTP